MGGLVALDRRLGRRRDGAGKCAGDGLKTGDGCGRSRGLGRGGRLGLRLGLGVSDGIGERRHDQFRGRGLRRGLGLRRRLRNGGHDGLRRSRLGLGLGLDGNLYNRLGFRDGGHDRLRRRCRLGLGLGLDRSLCDRLGGGLLGRRNRDSQAEVADRSDGGDGGRTLARGGRRGTGAEKLVERAADLARGRYDQLDRAAELVPDLLERSVVGRVGDGDEHALAGRLHREGVVVPAHALGQQLGGLPLVATALEAHELQPPLAGEQPGQVLLVDPALLEQDLAQPTARALALLEGRLELFLAQEPGPVHQGAERSVGPLPTGAVRLLHGGFVLRIRQHE